MGEVSQPKAETEGVVPPTQYDGGMGRPSHTSLAGSRAKDLRRRMPVSEARLWGAIKAKKTGIRFRRQVPIGYWIADFACLAAKLVVEIDDPSHEWRDEEARTAYFESLGFEVIRFTNEMVAKDLDSVVGAIEAWVEDRGGR